MIAAAGRQSQYTLIKNVFTIYSDNDIINGYLGGISGKFDAPFHPAQRGQNSRFYQFI